MIEHPQSRTIPLSQGKVAIVDASDYEWLSQYKWCAFKGNRTFYAARNAVIDGKRTTILMHRQILGLTDPRIQADHCSGYGLDNRRSNLRQATNQQNACNGSMRVNNTSGFRGVVYVKEHRGKKWKAQIGVDNRVKSLGYFSTPEQAARARDAAALALHSDFAKLNFPSTRDSYTPSRVASEAAVGRRV